MGTLAVLALGGTAAPNALAAGGSISGNVTGAPSHVEVAGVEVCALKTVSKGEIPVENNEHCAFTAPNGHYEIGSLDQGTYLPLFSPRVRGQNYLSTYYDADGLWPVESITVGESQLTGIDVELPEGGSVSGQVSEELGGKPLSGVLVCAGRGWESNEPRCVPTDAEGKYDIVGLQTDIYTIKFNPDYSGLQYFGESYDDQIFGNGHIQQPVSVSAGDITTGINAVLTPAAEIRGVVAAAANGAPLGQILVCIAPTDSFFETSSFADEAKCSRTSGSGAYSIKNLEGGQYKVLFSLELRDFIHYFPPLKPEEDGFPTRYWNEKDTLWEADVLTLTAPTMVTAIDARLGPFPPSPNTSITSSSPPPLPPATLRIPKRKCKPGRHLRKVRGKRRCVRPHFLRKHGRKPHSGLSNAT
ncbi:MAG TPA: carboxypeptidase regulatory-like domain-containing protein [Solirubrobacterales bacterium]|nr:carboxypeptidase regulatory-like domain-containing protein [Solirubrobacterales bacterium]